MFVVKPTVENGAPTIGMNPDPRTPSPPQPCVRGTGINSNTLRSAALASENSPMAVLQFVRLIRDARLPDRKLFLHSDELYQWLADVLTANERVRLMAFLSEGQVAPGRESSPARRTAR